MCTEGRGTKDSAGSCDARPRTVWGTAEKTLISSALLSHQQFQINHRRERRAALFGEEKVISPLGRALPPGLPSIVIKIGDRKNRKKRKRKKRALQRGHRKYSEIGVIGTPGASGPLSVRLCLSKLKEWHLLQLTKGMIYYLPLPIGCILQVLVPLLTLCRCSARTDSGGATTRPERVCVRSRNRRRSCRKSGEGRTVGCGWSSQIDDLLINNRAAQLITLFIYAEPELFAYIFRLLCLLIIIPDWFERKSLGWETHLTDPFLANLIVDYCNPISLTNYLYVLAFRAIRKPFQIKIPCCIRGRFI
ncbi:uncharacterized protein LOC423301 isoform X3 [Gallus gallus]|uniref:uncharacterized protein LOC423301 isoform X3 n=1 Tax=Gallus gallus TaxID=9031 RepID=UPI000739F05B|nr:uncharacterized protein LOC423301 isoform X3 [Gallus gallus]|eukprot:XP_015143104.1 uncharacterized protein LOC423301 isoform X1 [Gallus gallus]